MSDPVKNVEIEDVLSSIRRLISENDRTPKQEAPAEAPVPKPQDPVERGGMQGRLVLTPALRVTEGEALDGAEHAAQGADESPLGVARDHAWEDVEGAGDPDPAEMVAEAVEDDTPQDKNTESDVADMAAAEADDAAVAGYDPMEGVSLERAREIDSRIVHWDSMNESRGREEPAYEPDEPGDSDYAGTDVEPLEWQDDYPAEEEAAPHAKRTRPEGQEAAEVSPEEALAGLAGRIEAELKDSLPEQIEEALAPDPGLGDLAGEDAIVLDEAMLRDMVADIVRQELQGALGERITRNVRKLVRREIHRALAAHELD